MDAILVKRRRNMKNYLVNGLDYYIVAENKKKAVITAWANRWGIGEENLIEIERIPSNAEKVIYQESDEIMKNKINNIFKRDE